MLDVMRRIPQSDRAMRRGDWPLVLGYVLKGKTLGILGLGKIGTEVAAIGSRLRHERHCLGSDADHRAGGQIRCDLHGALDDVLKSADVVCVHLKLSEESKNLLKKRACA